MTLDQRIREGLLSTNTELPEPDTIPALQRVTSGAQAATRKRRLAAVATVASVAAAMAGVVVLASTGDDTSPSPAPAPSPVLRLDPEAAPIIAEGALASYGVDAAGSLLSVWTTCDSAGRGDPECGTAWLHTGPELQASGVTSPELGVPDVHPGGGGFVLQTYNRDEGLLVTDDGTKRITMSCSATSWPSTIEPGRHVLADGLLGPYLIDTQAGTLCDTTRFQEARTLGAGEVADDGTVWGLVDDGVTEGSDGFAGVGWYDGTQWSYHDLTGTHNKGANALAVSGELVAALHGDNGSAVLGLSVTTDGGSNWAEVSADDLPFTTYESMDFAGTSALFVTDGAGNLWRSTDFSTFTKVGTPGTVHGLTSADGAVVARLDGVASSELVRIDAAGTIEEMSIR
jgi:hypothetical protein